MQTGIRLSMYTNIFRNSHVPQTPDQLGQMSPQGDDEPVCGLQGVQQTDTIADEICPYSNLKTSAHYSPSHTVCIV